jgi:hypothetical protein
MPLALSRTGGVFKKCYINNTRRRFSNPGHPRLVTAGRRAARRTAPRSSPGGIGACPGNRAREGSPAGLPDCWPGMTGGRSRLCALCVAAAGWRGRPPVPCTWLRALGLARPEAFRGG